jgi:hypothetical protein
MDDDCWTGQPWNWNIPQFIEIDINIKKKELSTTPPAKGSLPTSLALKFFGKDRHMSVASAGVAGPGGAPSRPAGARLHLAGLSLGRACRRLQVHVSETSRSIASLGGKA